MSLATAPPHPRRNSTWTDVRDPKLSSLIYHPTPAKHTVAGRLPMAASHPSRAASPPINLRSFRFSSSTATDPVPIRARTPEVQSSMRFIQQTSISDVETKDLRPLRGKTSGDSAGSSSVLHDDTFTSNYTTTSSSFTSYERVSPRDTSPVLSSPASLHEPPERKRNRGSLLVAASDAISFFGGRKRKSMRQPILPAEFPEVIDISAARRDEELEERERLREAAAQALGLTPVLLQPLRRLEDSLEEVEEESAENDPPLSSPRDFRHARAPEMNVGRSPQPSSGLSLSSPLQVLTRHRQDLPSHFAHRRNSSAQSLFIPPFPLPLSALGPIVQAASTLPKYHPPTSLRIFTLAKQWKSRHMVLSSPAPSPSRFTSPTPSYLHLFKSASTDEKELERLEINEESIVFVAEEEVGGRKNVVKVGGQDVGALKKELNSEEAGRTMWLLQMNDQVEAQKWIAAIKNAILSQRAMRAGLGYPAPTLSGVEPRGDMDVMLSMRAQGIISSPTSPKFALPEISTPTQASVIPEHIYASSISSQSARSQGQGLLHKSSSTSAVSTLKSFFGNARPRSSSRAASLENDRPERDMPDDSLTHTHKPTNLRNVMRPPTGSDGGASIMSGPAQYRVPDPSFYQPSAIKSPLDRKIVEEPEVAWQAPVVDDVKGRVDRTLSAGSLQPPPRKRPWTFTPGVPAQSAENTGMYNHTNGNASIAGSFGAFACQDPAWPPSPTAHSFGSPTRERPSSIRSVSTFASVDPQDRSVPVSRRRSRQGGGLPRRLTPPSGPPPSIPEPHSPQSPSLQTTPQSPSTTRGETRSRTSSTQSAMSKMLLPVSVAAAHSKRTSTSSAVSVSTMSSSASPLDASATATMMLPQPPTNASMPRQNGMGVGGLVRMMPANSHRVSGIIPPPQRPAPTFAPPQPPSPESPTMPKPSLRDALTNRTMRLSLISPKPPPSMGLPPRPDEQQQQHGPHSFTPVSRSADATPTSSTPGFFTMPGFHRQLSSPFPPPDGPLPPPPLSQPLSGPPLASRRASLKQRLRILSTPSPLASASAPSPPAPPSGSRAGLMTTMMDSPLTSGNNPNDNTTHVYSPPIIGAKITNLRHLTDSFFAIMSDDDHTMPMPPSSLSPSSLLPPLEEPSSCSSPSPTSPLFPIPGRRSPDMNGFYPPPADSLSSSPELTSLSPPPRRGSRQIFMDELIVYEAGHPPTMPLSSTSEEQQQHEAPVFGPQSSVHSLGTWILE